MSIDTPAVAYDPRFPDTDEVPVESDWHRDQMNLLVELAWNYYRGRHGRTDFYAAGNMCMYYDPQDPRKVVGPDFFYVNGVPSIPRRRIWAVWKEGRYPNTITELLSPRTKNKDRKTNKNIYEKIFHTPEYFLYDPETEILSGWRLTEGRYAELQPNEDGWFWSEEMGLWLGFWEGDIGKGDAALWLRFFDRDGLLVPTWAESERQRAEQEHQRAEQERRRAEAAEAEIARLRALLDQDRHSDGEE